MSEKSQATTATQLNKVLNGNNYIPNDTIIRIEDLPRYTSLDQLFGKRYYKVLFLQGQQQIGHWVLLTHLKDKDLEYFDPAGKLPPQILVDWAGALGVDDIMYSQVPLQHSKSYNCGRFVLARISSQPTTLDVFIDVLQSSRSFTPDQMVELLFNVDSE